MYKDKDGNDPGGDSVLMYLTRMRGLMLECPFMLITVGGRFL